MHLMAKKQRRAVTIIEYGIIACLIAVISIAAITLLGQRVNNLYCTIETHISASTTNGVSNCQFHVFYGEITPLNWPTIAGIGCGSFCIADAKTIDSNVLYTINNISPITDISGVFTNDGSPATTLEQAVQAKNSSYSGTNGVRTTDGSTYQEEVKTADGNTYGVFYTLTNGNTMGYRNLATNETYIVNRNTGAVSSIGTINGTITNNSNSL